MGMLTILAHCQALVTIEWDDGEDGWRKAFQNLTCHAHETDYHFLKKLPSSDQQIIKQTSAVKRG